MKNEIKKIGIITIYDENNFGNRLQNYAVQEIIKKLGFYPETIKNINIVDGIDYLEEAKKVNSERRKRFLEFNTNINILDDVVYHHDVPTDFHESYDYFVIGSDQIWNHEFPDRFSDFVFANFAPSHKRIALSASFGINDIEKHKHKLYEKVKDIEHISVREDAGNVILQSHFGIDHAKTLIDPTMMLSTEEWEKVMRKPEKLESKKYILKYFLGHENDERKNQIKEFAEKNDCDIIDLNSNFFESGPSEFIYLIKNSEYIFTDSFHSCVFSLLFERPFLYFYREGNLKNINSRLETLFNKFEITGRTYTGNIEKDLENSSSININIKEKLIVEQEKVFAFLKNSIK